MTMMIELTLALIDLSVDRLTGMDPCLDQGHGLATDHPLHHVENPLPHNIPPHHHVVKALPAFAFMSKRNGLNH
jgi:hypothetical protein